MRATRILGAAAFAAVLAPAAASYAADPGFCRGYTESAIHQSQIAREARYCHRAIDEYPERWSMDRRGHDEWCRSVPREYADREREARHEILEECAHR